MACYTSWHGNCEPAGEPLTRKWCQDHLEAAVSCTNSGGKYHKKFQKCVTYAQLKLFSVTHKIGYVCSVIILKRKVCNQAMSSCCGHKIIEACCLRETSACSQSVVSNKQACRLLRNYQFRWCQGGERSVNVHGVRMERCLSSFTVLGSREVCHCSRCQDGEMSVIVHGVRMERCLSMFTMLGRREVCQCSRRQDGERSVNVHGVRMERGLSMFIVLGRR